MCLRIVVQACWIMRVEWCVYNEDEHKVFKKMCGMSRNDANHGTRRAEPGVGARGTTKARSMEAILSAVQAVGARLSRTVIEAFHHPQQYW